MEKKNRIVYLIPLIFLLLGMKSEHNLNSNYPILYFQPYTNNLTSEGKIQVDSMAVFFNQNTDAFNKWKIIVNPVHSVLENDSNCYLGIDRFRTLIAELKKRCHNSIIDKIYYKDISESLYSDRNGFTGLHLEIKN